MVATSRRVVLAPDKFKGTLSARELAEVMENSAAASLDNVETRIVPVADGGDGSVAAAIAAGWRRRTVTTIDAWGSDRRVNVAISAASAIVEVAEICGLGSRRPSKSDALAASTFGVGVVIQKLLEDGVRSVTLALGGSATTDAGVGMLRALGVRLLDGQGRSIQPDAAALLDVHSVDLSALEPRLTDLTLTLACDVATPMVGVDGSAEMFGPQKGADQATVELLSRSLEHAAHVLGSSFDAPRAHLLPRSGAAGGLAWAGVLLGGQLRSGSEVFLGLLNAETLIRAADLVITGEGRLDAQSLRGKAPIAIAELARRHNVPTVAIVGSNQLAVDDSPFLEVISLDQIDPRCVHDRGLSRELVAQVTLRLLNSHLRTNTSVNGVPT